MVLGDKGLGEFVPSCLDVPLEELMDTFRTFLCFDEVTFRPACFLRLFCTITPLANFSSLESLGGGGGDLRYTSRSILGGNLGLSNSVADGTHHIRIFENFICEYLFEFERGNELPSFHYLLTSATAG